MIKHEEDIIFQTQAEILIQEEGDELFWESHLSEMAEDSHNNETSRNTTYWTIMFQQAEEECMWEIYVKEIEDEDKEIGPSMNTFSRRPHYHHHQTLLLSHQQ